MKTLFKFLPIAVCIAVCFSCETDVPPIDNTPPTYSFAIEGDGFTHTFTEKDDSNTYQVNLKFNVPYKFVFLSYDKGGVINSEITMQREPFLKLNLGTDNLSRQWVSKNTTSLSRELDWFHQNGRPVDGSYLEGEFTFVPYQQVASDYGESREFFIRINDLGGQNHNYNQTFNKIPFYIATDNRVSEVIRY